MKIVVVAILLTPIAFSGPALARSGRTGLEAVVDAAVPWVAVAATAADRQSYSQQAQAEILDWRRRLETFGQRAETKGADADQAARRDLSDTWSATQAAANKLTLVGEEDWQSAKAAYEGARSALASAWDKVQPAKK